MVRRQRAGVWGLQLCLAPLALGERSARARPQKHLGARRLEGRAQA